MIARRGFFAALFGAPALVIAKPEAKEYTDPWNRAVACYLRSREAVTIEEVLSNAVLIRPSEQTQMARLRVITILRASGWQRFRVAFEGLRRREYRPTRGPGGLLNATR